VLTLLAEGHNNKEIARVLGISVRTVETHRQNIKAKLDIHTAAGLTRYAIEHALVQLS
jgi:two-component system nitrate/nitrite response regulator NarL